MRSDACSTVLCGALQQREMVRGRATQEQRVGEGPPRRVLVSRVNGDMQEAEDNV